MKTKDKIGKLNVKIILNQQHQKSFKKQRQETKQKI